MHEHAKELKLLYQGTQKGSSTSATQDHTETEIAWLLQVQGSTVCRFGKVLKGFSEIRI